MTEMKGCSHSTVKAYRDTFRLLLPYTAKKYGIKPDSLRIEHLSIETVLSFLNHLEKDRGNSARTRNHRLAAVKSLAVMIRLLYPEHRRLCDRIESLHRKRTHKPLVGYLTHQEIQKVLDSVDLKKNEGFRDYVLLHLLYDSGARAFEIAGLSLDDFDPDTRRLTLLGKGSRTRILELWPKTAQLLEKYIAKHRKEPMPPHGTALFTNQRRAPLTRFGIHRLCRRYLEKTLSNKRLKYLNPVHSFRHSCAIHMLNAGYALTDIKNRLGHERLESTMIYLKLETSIKKEIQKEYIAHTKSLMNQDRKLDELLDWGDRDKILNWLDRL